jgi:hypothetical protein
MNPIPPTLTGPIHSRRLVPGLPATLLLAVTLACSLGIPGSKTSPGGGQSSSGFTLTYITRFPAVIFDIQDGLRLHYHDFTSEKTADGHTWFLTGYTVTADRGSGTPIEIRFFNLLQPQLPTPEGAYMVEVQGVEMQGPDYADFDADARGPGLGLFFLAPGLAESYLKTPCDQGGKQTVKYAYPMPFGFMQKTIESISMICNDPELEYQVLFANYEFEGREMMDTEKKMGVIKSVEVTLTIT